LGGDLHNMSRRRGRTPTKYPTNTHYENSTLRKEMFGSGYRNVRTLAPSGDHFSMRLAGDVAHAPRTVVRDGRFVRKLSSPGPSQYETEEVSIEGVRKGSKVEKYILGEDLDDGPKIPWWNERKNESELPSSRSSSSATCKQICLDAHLDPKAIEDIIRSVSEKIVPEEILEQVEEKGQDITSWPYKVSPVQISKECKYEKNEKIKYEGHHVELVHADAEKQYFGVAYKTHVSLPGISGLEPVEIMIIEKSKALTDKSSCCQPLEEAYHHYEEPILCQKTS